MRTFLSLSLLACIGVFTIQARPDDTKLTPSELVAKHLESIGSAEARGRVHGTRIKGNSTVTVKLCGEGQVAGQVVMASQGPGNLINMRFDTADYPFELLHFDGKNFSASQFRPGSRTCLAQFFIANEVIFKEGLAGGTLSESWPLLNVQERNPKLEYAGLKKIGGKEVHVLKYSPRKGGSDLKIVLYFEADTFRHVRTEYTRVMYATEQSRIPGGGGVLMPPSEQRASNARFEAYEEFSDFKEEAGLNLPHTYNFHLSIQSEVRPALVDWMFNLTDFAFDAPLDPSEGKAPGREELSRNIFSSTESHFFDVNLVS
jgi:hypothetical protein